MAGSVIKGDIQRNGFLDKSGDGTAGQVRTLNSSDEEIWADAPGAGTATGHIIENAAGDDLVARGNLQFVGATVSDDAANDRTIVEVTQGERVVIGEDQFKVETAAGMTFDPPRTETGGTGDLSLLSSSIGLSSQISYIDENYIAGRSSNFSNLTVFDIANNTFSTTSEDISFVTNGGPITIDGTTLYVFNNGGELRTFNLNDLSESSTLIADFNTSPRGIAVINSVVYYVVNSNVFRVNNDNTSTQIFTFNITARQSAVTTDGTNLFIGDGNSGIAYIDPTATTITQTNLTTSTDGLGGIELLTYRDGELYFESSTRPDDFLSVNSTSGAITNHSKPANYDTNSFNVNGWINRDATESIFIFSTSVYRFDPRTQYTQTLALPNVTINTDTDKYVYTITPNTNLVLLFSATFREFDSSPPFGGFTFRTDNNTFSIRSEETERIANLDSRIGEVIDIGGLLTFTLGVRLADFNGQPRWTATLLTGLRTDLVNGTSYNISAFVDAGTLEIIDEEHYDMNFSLNITNSASFSGTGYQLFLDIDGLNSGTIVNELVSGTTTYNVTVPASIHRGNDIRIREFVPDAPTINAITTSWSAGSSWAVDEAAISGLQTSKVTLDPSAVTAGAASVTHNLNNRYLTVWVVYNGRTEFSRQQVISSFNIASNDTIDVTGLATDADIVSYTFLIQGF